MPPEKLPFGVPGAYWLGMRAYDPVAALNLPMFFLQGKRDYQITVDGDLAG